LFPDIPQQVQLSILVVSIDDIKEVAEVKQFKNGGNRILSVKTIKFVAN